MTTQEVANRLYELCREGQYHVAHDELYADDATSTEREPSGEIMTVNGIDGTRQKSADFNNRMEEMHDAYTHEPTVFGNNIFMEMGMDMTMKGMGRMDMKEMCHYEVADGKIVSERFYY